MNRIINILHYPAWLPILVLAAACNNNTMPDNKSIPQKGTYAYDRTFLQQHSTGVIELYNEDSSAKVLLSAAWQGRVMTSTATGDSGTSFGWLNYDLLSAKEKRKQFNPVGGEERFWLGPEGGQYAFYFKKGDSFNIAHWQVPAIIDTLGYEVVKSDRSTVTFAAKASLTNYSGSVFDIDIKREVNLLTNDQLTKLLGVHIGKNIHSVAYATMNTIANTGSADWTKETGLPSIWLLGMFTPTPQTVVIIPFKPLPNARSLITDSYFGTIPAERLQVKDSVLFFTCDGKYRSKIGLSPLIAKPLAASYDFANNALTVVVPDVYDNREYVNSKWEQQKEPYKGDVINSYNDGPLADGTQMGPFYEIESSSPALALKKGETGMHRQITCHLQGDFTVMKDMAKQLLGVDLEEVRKSVSQ
jgi:hypothetical protein